MKLTKFELLLSALMERAGIKMGKKGHATAEQLATSLLIESQHLVDPVPPVKKMSRIAGIIGREPRDGERIVITIDKDGNGFTTEYQGNDPDRSESGIALIRETAKLLDGYAQHHLAKSPPDIDKAARNVRQAHKLYESIGEPYNPPAVPVQEPQDAAREAQERDLLPGTGERPLKGSDAPLDRQELLDWFDMKLEGCAKHGMRQASDVLQAFRNEVAQHLEAAPIDFAVALDAFYDDCHARNVKAGWWTDLATGLPKKRSVGELFILFVTELAEAYRAYLSGEPDDKLPEYPGLGVELGDLQIRLADFCGALRAGRIVENTETRNPGNELFYEIVQIAESYERIRKTDAAKGDEEMGQPIPSQAVGEMVVAKLAFNAQRPDHKIENRVKEDGKRT